MSAPALAPALAPTLAPAASPMAPFLATPRHRDRCLVGTRALYAAVLTPSTQH